MSGETEQKIVVSHADSPLQRGSKRCKGMELVVSSILLFMFPALQFIYSRLSLLRYCWDRKKVSIYPDYRYIQYKFQLSDWDIKKVS